MKTGRKKVRNPSKNKFKGFTIIFEKTGNASKNSISGRFPFFSVSVKRRLKLVWIVKILLMSKINPERKSGVLQVIQEKIIEEDVKD